ncbi:MAG: DsbA family protein [Vicinamibacterales bacterium]
MTRPHFSATAYLLVAVTAVVSASGVERPATAMAGGGGGGRRAEATLSIESGQAIGSADAPAVLVVFADFKCRYCAAFMATALPVLRDEYVRTGQLQIAYMHDPLPYLRRHSLVAAEVAECAAEQGLFWPVHDAYFLKQSVLDDRLVWDLAAAEGARLDGGDGLRACVASGRALVRVADQAALAHQFRVIATPAFVVGARDATGTIHVVGQLSGGGALADIRALVGKIVGR